MTKSSLLFGGFIVAATAIAVPVFAAVALEESGVAPHDLAALAGVIQLVRQAYVHPIASDELVKDALKGMLTRLDPHSDYMDAQEYKQSQTDMSGKFGGLGMQISAQDGTPKVVAPIDDTPAAHAKLEPGDLIVMIDHLSTQGVSLQKVVDQLRGDPGTSVTITVLRGKQEPFDVTLTREIIKVASVKTELKPGDIGYVRITQFGGDTSDGFKQALTNFKNSHVKGLVIDLRNDPGGLLTAAVDVSGDLLDGGTVVSIRGRKADDQKIFSAPAHGDMLPGTPVVVLINGASASASEIVSGALQDRHRATVMGTQSFGKGSVQTIIPLKNYGAVRLTTALYYTPSGRSIQDEGVAPSVVVEAPKDQQITGGALIREAALQGAFENPGSLDKTPAGTAAAAKPATKTTLSAPIRADLIGKPNDAQLNVALAFLDKASGGQKDSEDQPPAASEPK